MKAELRRAQHPDCCWCPADADRCWSSGPAVLVRPARLGDSGRAASAAPILVGLLARGDRGLAALLVGVLRPVRRLGFGRGAGRRRQIELGRHHQRRPLAILDACVLHVGAADAAHEIVDDLLFEGHVVVLVVILGAGRRRPTCTRPMPSGNGGQTQRRASVRRGVSAHIRTAVSVSRIALHPVQIFVERSAASHASRSRIPQPVRIGRDQGAFAAGTPRKESYSRAATPATMATSARLNTYQL